MPSVEDRFAISELLNRMGYYYDEDQLDALAACFSSEAVMSMQIAAATSYVLSRVETCDGALPQC